MRHASARLEGQRVGDAEDAARVFELLMGTDVVPGKDFIVQAAYEVDAEAIDA